MNPLVLIADDDKDNRDIMDQALRHSGFRTVHAADGLEAVEAASKERPDLILMDLSMPKMDGWTAARRLRQTPGILRIPIVAFTAHAMKGDELKAKEAGFDDYISKPCVPKEVVCKVEAWLRAGKRTSDG